MTFDICIPTFQREAKLKRCLNSVSNQKNIKIFIYFDNNDYHTMNQFNDHNSTKTLMNRQHRAFGIWNYHLGTHFKSDIFVYLCDDTVFYPDTLVNVEKHFNKKFPDTDGVVTFKQANMQGSDSAMGCIGRKFAERYPNRQAFNPNYKSFYADTDIGDYAKKLGKFHYGEDCSIDHFHPSVFKNEIDFTHSTIRDKEKDIDIKINKIRKEKGLLYPETLEMIDRSTI